MSADTAELDALEAKYEALMNGRQLPRDYTDGGASPHVLARAWAELRAPKLAPGTTDEETK